MLKTRIFLRTGMLLLALIGFIAAALMFFAVREHRTETKRSYHTIASVLAGELERLILWDDRVAIRQALDREIKAHQLIEYSLVVRNGQVYMSTFDGAFPTGLLHTSRTKGEAPFVWEFLDPNGAVYYDMAVSVGETGAILRIGMKRHNIDKQAYPVLLTIALVSFIVLLVGLIFSYRIALRATREITLLSEAIQSYSNKGDETRLRAVGNVADVTELARSFIALVSERKLAENELRESMNKYLTLLKTTSEGFWFLNSENITTEVNPSLCRMLGYSREEMLGKTPLDFVDDENRKIFIEHTLKIATSQHRSYEITLKKKNGENLFARFNSTTLKDPSGNLKGAFAFITDLSDRKKYIDERNLLFTAIEQSAESVFITDRTGKIQYVNPAFERLTGYSAGEVIGQNPRILKSGKQDDLFYKDMWEKLNRGKIFKGRIINKKKDGTFYTGEATISPVLDDSGKIANFVSIKRDVTKEIEMENLLVQASKMESIGTLAGGIAHDFNNILSSIIGFTELAIDEVDKDTSIEDSLQEVYAAGKRAKDLVKQILAFARQSDEEIKPIQLSVIAKEVLKFIRSSIPTTIEIKQNIESDSLIMGNATQVHQVLMNLCTNAAHAMEDEGGILELSLKDIVIDTSVNGKLLDLKYGDYIEIKVSDSGVGIAPEIMDSIFEPYFTTKGPGEGTGMGLAMVHGIVESYGGKITMDSILGKGTTFTIYLPITRKRKAHRPYEPEELPCGTERILFVDDEASIAKISSQILKQLGYKVTARTSSVEALELFRSRPNDFDLVITDMTMPNMTGDKLAANLMKIRTDIPVILCTGYSKKVSDETASKIGIKAFAYKPIVKADLAKTIRKVLDEAKSYTQG